MSLIYLLLNPIFQILALLVATAFFYFRKKPKPTKTLLIVTLSYFVLITSTPIPEWLTYSLERKYTPFRKEKNLEILKGKRPLIMVLGAGIEHDPELPDLADISQTELARLAEGIRIYQALGRTTLVTSAFSDAPRSQAEVVAGAAVSLGVNPADTAWLVRPVSTETEALAFKERFGVDQPLILVTDAVHMKRAMFWFEKYGMKPVAAPTNYRYKINEYDWHNPFKPSLQKLLMMEKWYHETVGMLWARVRILRGEN